MLRNVLFFSIVTSVLFLIHAVVYAVLVRAFGYELPFWYLLLFLLSISFIVAFIAVKQTHSALAAYSFILTASWVGTVFLLFCATILYVGISLLTDEKPFVLAGLLLLALLLSVYALWNGHRLVVREYKIPLPQLNKTYRIIHLSDLHIGTIKQKRYLERVVGICNSLKPDLVLISGDLFDGSLPSYKDILEPLNSFCAPCYLSLGNHELYEGYDTVRNIMADSKVVFLEDRMINAGEIQVIGVNYRQNVKKSVLKTVLDTLQLHDTKATILLYHEPVGWEEARDSGIDLMLSGHTHNGQVAPFNLLVRLFYAHTVGLFKEDSRYLHVSPGTGTWGPPMRLGSNNQITLFELVPKH